jgi:hypothetical protein
MDQIGQKQKANEQNRIKPRPRTVSTREIPLHRDQLQRTAGGNRRRGPPGREATAGSLSG